MKLLTAFAILSVFVISSCDTKVDPDKDIRASSKNQKNEADKIDALNTYGNDKDGRNSIVRDKNGTIQSNSDDDTIQ